MENVITQLGVGGILVLLVLREVFKFLSDRKIKNGHNELRAGDRSVEFWQSEQKKNVKNGITEILAPFLAVQIDLLREIKDSSKETRDSLLELLLIQRENSKRER